MCSERKNVLVLSGLILLTKFMRKTFFVFFIILTNVVCAVHSYGTDNFGDFDVHYQLGNEYNKRGMVDDAILEYKKAIEINDRSPKLYNNLGVAYGKKTVRR